MRDFCGWMERLLIKAGGEIFGFFVASFSQRANDLGQWRAYADNGRGVAIGFAPFKVISEASHITEKTCVGRVIYDPAVCISNMTNAIRRAVGVIQLGDPHTSEADYETFGKAIANHLAVLIFWYAITCKDAAYLHEEEIRLLLVNQLDQLSPFIETRVRGSSLVPYIPCPLDVRSPEAITKIMIGPAADDLAEDAIRHLLRKHKLPLDILERSNIPYTAR